jgi:hypothetical protein
VVTVAHRGAESTSAVAASTLCATLRNVRPSVEVPDALLASALRHVCQQTDDTCLWNEFAQFPMPLARMRALDATESVQLYSSPSASFVAKLGSAAALATEAAKARTAAALLVNTSFARAATQCLVKTTRGTVLGISRYLGEDLTSDSRRVSPAHVACILDLLDSLSIDHPGFVPRNCIWGADDLMLLIDWEHARFGSQYSRLSLIKVTNAWSEYFGEDVSGWLGRPIASGVLHELDGWDRTLLALHDLVPLRVDEQVETGVWATLESERWTASAPRAASVGHRIDDVIGRRLSVYYTLASAYVRSRAPDRFDEWIERRGAQILEDDDDDACLRSIEDLTRIAVGVLWRPKPRPMGVPSIPPWLVEFPALGAATQRARCVEELVCGVWQLMRELFRLGSVELLLRGSLSQGLMTKKSDIDFEISAPVCPDGHRPLEELFAELLQLFGYESEGSTGRPVTYDIGIVGKRTCRDAFELLELRRPGTPYHLAGWLETVVDIDAIARFAASTATAYEATFEHGSDKGKLDWVSGRMSIYRDYLRRVSTGRVRVTHTVLQLDAFPPRERVVRAKALEEALLRREGL